MEKKCTKCKEVKSLDEFYNSKGGKDGRSTWCKSCFKEYRNKNKEKLSQIAKKYYKYNREDKLKKCKEYREKNKEKLRIKYKKYLDNNKGYHLKYKKLRRKTDPFFKLRLNISSNIERSLSKNGYSKKTKTYNMLKCEYTFFMEWLNGLASNGYTYGIGNLHLDHVVPISLAETEEEMLLLCHYSNYQLLSADENLTKGNRYVNPTNLKRVLEHHPNPDKIREIHARL